MTPAETLAQAGGDEKMRTELRWMVMVNDQYRSGLYGASLRRHGPADAAEACVRAGFARRVDEGTENSRGYWITSKGREHLHTPRTERDEEGECI